MEAKPIHCHQDDIRLLGGEELTKLEKIAFGIICLIATPCVVVSGAAVLPVYYVNELIQQCRRGYYALQRKQVIRIEEANSFLSHYKVIG